MYRTRLLLVPLILRALAGAGWAGGAPCPIVPLPKVYTDTGRTAELLAPEAAAIVVGAKASEPERYAAERLRDLVSRRFQRKLSIQVEGAVEAGVRQVILLGQRATNAWLDKLAAQKQLVLDEEKPGPDGFVIEVADDGGCQVVLVGGSNPRGVVYGQDAFFGLLRQEGDKVVFPVASVSDCASIPWRGRAYWEMGHHMRRGTLDAYARWRVNFIDLRGDRSGPAPEGFEAGAILNKLVAKRVVAEAHRRGIFVYGTVACPRKPRLIRPMLATIEDVFDVGADGVWVSFGEGTKGLGTEGLFRDIVAACARCKRAGHQIAISPPWGAHLRPDREFTLRGAAVPGLADATWVMPYSASPQGAGEARALGLTRLPCAWMLWPPDSSGLLNSPGADNTLRRDERPTYHELPPLAASWDAAAYEPLRSVARFVDGWLFWGSGQEDYVAGAFGAWAWAPERHDCIRTRQAIYGLVFGPGQAAAAQAFDAALAQLEALFFLPGPKPQPGVGWPPRLRLLEERPVALKLIGETEAALKTLEAQALANTLIDPARLRDLYLEPMRATVALARTMAEIDYPEYALLDLQSTLFDRISQQQLDAARKALAEADKDLGPKVAAVARALDALKGLEEYQEVWKRRLSDLSYWTKLATQEQSRTRKAFVDYAGKDYGNALDPIAAPPAGKPLAQLAPSDWLRSPAVCLGGWCAGLLRVGGQEAAGIAFPFWEPGDKGLLAQLVGELPVPQFEGRLMLDAFIGNRNLVYNIPGVRLAQLWVNGRLAWEQDVARRHDATDWTTVDVTEQAKAAGPLKLVFRVINKAPSTKFETVTFIGPVRLRGAPAAAEPKE